MNGPAPRVCVSIPPALLRLLDKSARTWHVSRTQALNHVIRTWYGLQKRNGDRPGPLALPDEEVEHSAEA